MPAVWKDLISDKTMVLMKDALKDLSRAAVKAASMVELKDLLKVGK